MDQNEINEIIEKEWHHLLLQQHILKKNGYSKFEMNTMTSEERHAIIELIIKDDENQRNASKIKK